MQLSTHLNFNGRCAEAFKFYQHCLGGEIQTMIKWGESPNADHVGKEWNDKIMHASLNLGDSWLLGADSPEERFEKPAGFAVAVSTKDPQETERVFNALAEKGKVTMPVQKTFWSPAFGMLVDQFGISWMINCEQPQ